MAQMPTLPKSIDPQEALESLPGDVKTLLAPLGNPGLQAAGDLHNLQFIKTEGTYVDGVHDGALLGMALATVGGLLIQGAITPEVHDFLHLYALKAANLK